MAGQVGYRLRKRIQNMPVISTSFVGREQELIELTRYLQDAECCLLTIFGPGGIGKTRLALEAATGQLGNFADGVYFIPLASIAEPAFLVSTFAQALDFVTNSVQATESQLLQYLSEKSLLLILDNFEHLVDSADWLAAILNAAPNVKMMVTSRQRLQLQQEWVFEVQGLDTPEAQIAEEDTLVNYGATRLFLERANRAHAGFVPDTHDKQAIVRISRLVQGMPLALELAATWVRVLSCQEIAREITQDTDFLRGSLRDMPDRHRSMKAVLEYSWRLLSEAQRRAFWRLSVFRGGFRFEAARAVTDIELPSLARLVDQALIRGTPTGRYEIHELLRQLGEEYLRQKPEEWAEVRQLHALYYLTYLRQHEATLTQITSIDTIKPIIADIDNVRLAWNWAVEQVNETALLETLDSLCKFHQATNQIQEAETILAAAVKALEENIDRDGLLFCKLIARQARFSILTAKFAESKALLERSLAAAQKLNAPDEIALNLNLLGLTQIYLGRNDEAAQLCQQSLQLYQSLADEDGAAQCYYNLGFLCIRQGDFAAACEHFRQGVGIARRLGDSRNLARMLSALGFVLFYAKDLNGAKQILEESLTIATQGENKPAVATSLYYLGVVHGMGLELYEEAEQFYRKGLALYKELGNRDGVANTLQGLADLAYRLENFQDAKQYYLEFLKLKQRIGDWYGSSNALSGLGDVAYQLGEDVLSLQYYQEALGLAHQVSATGLFLSILPGLALLLKRRDEAEAATALLALAVHHPLSVPQTRETALAHLAAFPSAMARTVREDTVQALALIVRNIAALVELAGLPKSCWTALLAPLDASIPAALEEPLTDRELEVLRLLADGLSNRDIAQRLVLGAGTVKTHTLNIYRKLSVRSRTQAVIRAQALGLL